MFIERNVYLYLTPNLPKNSTILKFYKNLVCKFNQTFFGLEVKKLVKIIHSENKSQKIMDLLKLDIATLLYENC